MDRSHWCAFLHALRKRMEGLDITFVRKNDTGLLRFPPGFYATNEAADPLTKIGLTSIRKHAGAQLRRIQQRGIMK